MATGKYKKPDLEFVNKRGEVPLSLAVRGNCDNALKVLIECGECKMWVHCACDQISVDQGWDKTNYRCPVCRNSKAGEGLELPSRRPRSVGKCSSGVPQAAHGLPANI